jgi:tetratricopeptide (TPR) repeat protein
MIGGPAVSAGATGLGGPETALQEPSVQKLFERGALEEAVEQAARERGNPESTYLAAQALSKMDDTERAGREYARLVETGDDGWKAIGESGQALLAGDVDTALAAATRARNVNAENPYAHYQVGLVALRQSAFQRAADAFARSAALKPDLAYSHYYAGLAYQRVKQIAKMSEHLDTFLRLAPEAPERAAVATILRTLRPLR